jgi:quercetin dioxygenase-like cupin family protein
MNDFQSRLLLAIHGIAEDDLRRPEGEGRWSIADVIAHLGDLEIIYAVRIRTALAHDEPDLAPMNQNDWVASLHRDQPVPELLEQFWFLRRSNLALKSRLTEAQLARTGKHPHYGVITVAQMYERIANHDEKHLGQIERIKETLGLTATSKPNLAGAVVGKLLAERSPGPGVHVRELWADGVKRALEVEFDPGAQWPGLDYHVPGPEEMYVLSGTFDDNGTQLTAGTFVHYPAGTSHSPKSAEGGRLFVFYPEG